jgi:excisionase family DNA binding protein
MIRVNDGRRDWTVGEVCDAFGVCDRTVKRWHDDGRIRGYRMPVGQRNRRFPPRAVYDFAVANHLPVPVVLLHLADDDGRGDCYGGA